MTLEYCLDQFNFKNNGRYKELKRAFMFKPGTKFNEVCGLLGKPGDIGFFEDGFYIIYGEIIKDYDGPGKDRQITIYGRVR